MDGIMLMRKKRMAGENLKEDRRWLNHFYRRHTEQLNNKCDLFFCMFLSGPKLGSLLETPQIILDH